MNGFNRLVVLACVAAPVALGCSAGSGDTPDGSGALVTGGASSFPGGGGTPQAPGGGGTTPLPGGGGTSSGAGGFTPGAGGFIAGAGGFVPGAGGFIPAAGGAEAAGSGPGAGGAPVNLPKFSFFVTSVGAMKELSGNPMGFGGDLRYGEATGLAGADKICRTIADKAMPGAGQKTWRAFLSVGQDGPGGPAVHAIDRVGSGPWYDAMERPVAMSLDDLRQERPRGADAAIINDLPNEYGIPNHKDGAPGCTDGLFGTCPDNHDTLTGTGPDGRLYNPDARFTCQNWTSNGPGTGTPWCGHSWPRDFSGRNWMSALPEGGCQPGINLVEMGPPNADTVGAGGGYGGIYCFATTP